MKYEIFLTPRAKKQYEKLDPHIRKEIKTLLSELEDEPYNKGKPLKDSTLNCTILNYPMQVSNTVPFMISIKRERRY
jgi:hypothetical protein